MRTLSLFVPGAQVILHPVSPEVAVKFTAVARHARRSRWCRGFIASQHNPGGEVRSIDLCPSYICAWCDYARKFPVL